MARTIDIVIVGAGIAGLAAALAFARQGISSTVLDRSPRHYSRERGDVLHTGAVTLLHSLGVADCLVHHGARCLEQFEILDQKGRTLLNFEFRRLQPTLVPLVLRYHSLRAAMLEACEGTGLVRFVWNVAAESLLREGPRIAGVATSVGPMSASLVVLACGANAPISTRNFPDEASHDYGSIFVNGHLHCDRLPFAGGVYAISKRGILVGVPLSEHSVRIGLQLYRGDTDILDHAQFLETAAQRLDRLGEHDLIVEGLSAYPLRSRIAEHFWHPGVVLCGDAAHTVHPVGGQGMGLAIRDGVSLASVVGTKPCDLDAACRSWAQDCHQAAKRVFRRTHFLGKLSSRAEAFLGAPAKIALQVLDLSYWLKNPIFSTFARGG